MKRTVDLMLAGLLSSFFMVAGAFAQQSLGDVARQQRETKRPPAAKVYTNDEIASSPDAAAASDKPAKSEATPDKAEKSDKAAAGADAKAKLAADLKAKENEQKKTIAQLERELDVAQREYRLKVAVYYADAGNSLRDSKKWAEEDRKQKTELEGKQKAVNEAKQKLAEVQEQARKAGLGAN